MSDEFPRDSNGNPSHHRCYDCGYVWKHGQHGGHDCKGNLKAKSENWRKWLNVTLGTSRPGEDDPTGQLQCDAWLAAIAKHHDDFVAMEGALEAANIVQCGSLLCPYEARYLAAKRLLDDIMASCGSSVFAFGGHELHERLRAATSPEQRSIAIAQTKPE